MDLPTEFLQRMKATLGAQEFEHFLQSYDSLPAKGLRLNRLKLADASLLPEVFGLQPVAWCDGGFYYQAKARAGAHPYHQAGLYYLQDPSAMAVVEALQVNLGDKVLDLCAAPGGKSTQVAGKLQNSGLLVANEVLYSRAKVLRENLQRMGARNTVVLSNDPAELAQKFSGFFDKVLVDAPCSGEGLFRKNPDAAGEWSQARVAGCAKRQRGILREAAKMVASGGRLIYSTCTFAPEENEQQIEAFLGEHPQFSRVQVDGLPCFGEFSSYQIFPHVHKGEGHFLAVLGKSSQNLGKVKTKSKMGKRGRRQKRIKNPQYWSDFAQKFLRAELAGELFHLNDNLYLVDFALGFDLAGLNALSIGLHLGKESKGRFVPSHALALALRSADVSSCLDLGCDDVAGGLAQRLVLAGGGWVWSGLGQGGGRQAQQLLTQRGAAEVGSEPKIFGPSASAVAVRMMIIPWM